MNDNVELNATYLFELTKGKSEQEFALPCSESFWTTVFTLFLLGHSEQIGSIRVWHYQRQKPYFKSSQGRIFDLRGLHASHIAVEPSVASHIRHFGELVNDSSEEVARWSGFRPDLLVRRPLTDGRHKYTFVEVKTGSISAASQLENYSALISELTRKRIPCEFFFLCSVGGKALDTSVLSFQQMADLNEKFAVLLWEEVFLEMAALSFQPLGTEIDWTKYSEAFRSHCQS